MGEADRIYISQRQEVSSRCASQCSSTQTAELVVIMKACSIFLWLECVKYDYQVFDINSAVLIDGKF